MVHHALRTWEEDRGEDSPLMEVAANWLLNNLPELHVAGVVTATSEAGTSSSTRKRGKSRPGSTGSVASSETVIATWRGSRFPRWGTTAPNTLLRLRSDPARRVLCSIHRGIRPRGRPRPAAVLSDTELLHHHRVDDGFQLPHCPARQVTSGHPATRVEGSVPVASRELITLLRGKNE